MIHFCNDNNSQRAEFLYDTCARLRALCIKHCNNTQPNPVMHYMSRSAPHSPCMQTHARVRTHHNPPNLSPQTSSSLCQESGSSSQSFRSCPSCRSCCDRWTRVCWGGSWWCPVSASWPETGRLTSSRDGQRDCLPWHRQTPDHLKMWQPELKWSTGWL